MDINKEYQYLSTMLMLCTTLCTVCTIGRVCMGWVVVCTVYCACYARYAVELGYVLTNHNLDPLCCLIGLSCLRPLHLL